MARLRALSAGMLVAGPLLAVPLGGFAPESAAAPRYAALPLRNATLEVEAGTDLWRTVQGALEARGASFLPEEALERFLRSRRIRYTDSMTVVDARDLGTGEGVDFVLASTLLRFDRTPVPEITLAVRTIDVTSGGRVQSAVVSLRGDDTKGLLGLGAVEDADELALEITARVLDDFDPEGAPTRAPRRGSSGRVDDAFVAEGFDPSSITRIAILPPVNRTNRQEAAAHVAEHFAHQWFRIAGAEVVEASELRAALIRARVRSLEMLDENLLRLIGREVGTRYFCLGSVEHYAAATVFTEHGLLPEVEIALRVLDVVDGKIVAAAGVHRGGDDYHKILGLGNVRSLGALTERAAGELIATITR